MASRLPARSRARAASDRSERRTALLALRSSLAKHLHARLPGRSERNRRGAVQRLEPVAVLGHRRRARYRSTAFVQYKFSTAGIAKRNADDRSRRRVSRVSRDGGQSARLGSREFRRLDQ